MDRVRANGMNLKEGRTNDQRRRPIDDNQLIWGGKTSRHIKWMQEINKHK